MLTEREVSRSWRKLFRENDFTDDTFARAQTLLDGLRPESPLRHRLENELDELKRLKTEEPTTA